MDRDQKRLSGIGLVALIGAGLSISLAIHYYDLRNGTAAFRSYCNWNQSFNCDAVAATAYAEAAPGVPVASLSAGWYLALLFLSLLGWSSSWRPKVTQALLPLAAIGTLISAAYLILMATQIRTYCLQCLLLDAVAIAILFLSWKLARPAKLVKTKLLGSDWIKIALIVVGSIGFSTLFMKTYDQSSKVDGVSTQDIVLSILNRSPVSVDPAKTAPSLGSSSAPITIVEFSDFQCPYCRIAAKTISTLLHRFPAQVRLVYLGFPLDPACNHNIPAGSGHPAACEAAIAALCADQQGKFSAVYETLFEHQKQLAPGVAQTLATQAGADAERLKNCMGSKEIKDRLTDNILLGDRLGVESTPTFFINGYRVEGAYPLPVWIGVVEELLRRASSAGASSATVSPAGSSSASTSTAAAPTHEPRWN